ncbi:MAG: zinc-dependent peptidase [Marinilabiliaceae bacterium]|nr:zinc-dependent peptidase [Marinilabiliaceae bacterium]
MIGLLAFIFGMCLGGIIILIEYKKYQQSEIGSKKQPVKPPNWKMAAQLLGEEFHYFQQLPASLKNDFILRTLQFMRQIKWISPENKTIDKRKKILISASAVQLTFGLPRVHFGFFKKIIVFDDIYYNKLTKHYHKGEVNQHGSILLSWKYFELGYANPTDRINLGLHEMAHALDLAIFLSQGRKYYLRRLMEHFQKTAFSEFLKLKNAQSDAFRAYGGTNIREFFSVAVEHFFEDPQHFSQTLPELYLEMCRLLNQDPINKIARGYQPPQSFLHSNTISASTYKMMPAQIQIKPSWRISIPIFFISIIYWLAVPVMLKATAIHNLNLLISMLVYIMAGSLYASVKGHRIKTIDGFLIIQPNWFSKRYRSINLKNILYVEFTNELYAYTFTAIFFAEKNMKEQQLSLYCSSAKIKQLERILMQSNVMVKHNNRWIQK